MRILVVNFFPAFHPPRSGGEQRYFYLYQYLSRHHDVTLLSPTYSSHAPELVAISPTFREHRVPKDPICDRLHAMLDARGIGPECSAYVVALAGAAETQFGLRFRALVADADVIIHESPFTFPYDRTQGRDGKPRIYNAYNLEHRLAAQVLRGEAGRKAVEFIRFLEQSLVGASSLVFVTCDEEREQFVADFGVARGRIALAPNGFEPGAAGTSTQSTVDDRCASVAVFMGSGHPPNVEAALFIVERLAPELPGVEFRLMGAVCDHLPSVLPRNVTKLGFIEESEKQRELAACGVALNPLFSGAGTNLKMLDYMAAGAPIVTTPIGARGLALTDRVDAFIADGEQYGDVLKAVLGNRATAVEAGAAAKRRAFGEFTWERIGEQVRGAIEAIPPWRDETASDGLTARRRLLVVNDYPVAAATGGGQIRIRGMLTELGREFDVIFLSLAPDRQRYEGSPARGVKQISVPKTTEHRAAEAQAARESAISIADILAVEYCIRNDEFVAAFRLHATRCHAIIFEHVYLAPLLEFVPPESRVVYSSHNVESNLKAAVLRQRANSQRWISRVAELERSLIERADLVVCVSERDRAHFRRDFPDKRFEVIENGAWVQPAATGASLADRDLVQGRTLAVFLGSGHTPNVQAARFLLENVAPAVSEVTIGIIGSVCGAIRLMPRPRNVVLFGVLDEADKNALLGRATLAVNPMLAGGGSSLKVPDFFAIDLPLVSTQAGVRGYDLRDGEHYIAAERADFAGAVRRVAGDPELRRRVAAAAHAYAEAVLDWRVLGARYRRLLRSLVEPEAKPRVLVATYRYADPPPGGAEAYMVNVLRALAKRGQVEIDVATCDIGAIADKWHFSAEYGSPPTHSSDSEYVRAVHRFPVDPPAPDTFEHCRRLFALWMAESRAQAQHLLRLCDAPLLLGGWNFPETRAGTSIRWTSAEAQLHVGSGASALILEGHAPTETRLNLLRGESLAASRSLNGAFAWRLELPGDEPVVTLRVDAPFVVEGDPRELGVVIAAIEVKSGDHTFVVDMSNDFAGTARRKAPDRWVESLIEITEGRDRCDDDLFVAVRGPHSAEFHRWLLDNVASYDVVLAQGVPFATPVEVTAVAQRQHVPVVLLPHFHMEDRYYHWRGYYDAFRRADCVIAAPTMVKAMFFDAIGATSKLAPGGGIELHEYDEENLARCRQVFRALHTATAPFVLVLGRKAGAKNYRQAIDAVQEINRGGHRLDLVLIGPDDDGLPVSAPHACYYGAQPRDVVLGALSLSVCLVNMSESESFGIVLLESWLAGRPVVAQRQCLAFTDLVASGRNGFLADSPAEIIRAIESYLSNADLAVQHARQGRLIAEQHSWSRVAERIERIIVDVARPVDALPERSDVWPDLEALR